MFVLSGSRRPPSVLIHVPPEPSELAQTIRYYLEENPAETEESSGQLAASLWKANLLLSEVTPEQVAEALEELGTEMP